MTLDDVPPWALFGIPAVIVIIALMRSNSGGGGVSYGAVTAYQPTPSDPGLVGLAESQVAARSQAFGSVVGILGAEEISRISANRDTALQTIQAGVDNARTEAARQAALASTDAARLVGIHASDNETAVAMENARTASHIADSEGATRKYEAKEQAKTGITHEIVGGVTAVVKGIGKLFGF